MVDDPPLRDTVTLTGYIEGAQKAEIFSAHHIFCLPSWDEGMPTCVLEAMILGLPVVATPVGALTDFFIEGKMGRLVPVRDPARLAIVIEEMAADLPALKRMALFNHEYAMRRFPASLVAKRLRMIYSKTVR